MPSALTTRAARCRGDDVGIWGFKCPVQAAALRDWSLRWAKGQTYRRSARHSHAGWHVWLCMPARTAAASRSSVQVLRLRLALGGGVPVRSLRRAVSHRILMVQNVWACALLRWGNSGGT